MLLPLLPLLPLVLSSPTSTPTPGTTQLPPLETLQCFHCYLHQRHNETRLYLNSADLLTWQTSGRSLEVGANYLEHCQKVSCSGLCVLVNSTVQLSLPETLQYPTVQPWYESTEAPPVPRTLLIQLEYRTCAAPRADFCSSYLELKSESCQVETCSEDLCNGNFQTDSQILIIVLAAVLSLLVCVAMVTVICCWYFKIRPRKDKNYRPLDLENVVQDERCQEVGTEMVKIEENSDSCNSRTAEEKKENENGKPGENRKLEDSEQVEANRTVEGEETKYEI